MTIESMVQISLGKVHQIWTTIDERITRLVSLFMSSLNRANVRAYPVESSDMARSKIVSSFLKWMTTSGYIPRLKKKWN